MKKKILKKKIKPKPEKEQPVKKEKEETLEAPPEAPQIKSALKLCPHDKTPLTVPLGELTTTCPMCGTRFNPEALAKLA